MACYNLIRSTEEFVVFGKFTGQELALRNVAAAGRSRSLRRRHCARRPVLRCLHLAFETFLDLFATFTELLHHECFVNLFTGHDRLVV